MCIEYISIALCAPTKVPSLSFTCGQLHLIAGRREACEKAKGACVCYFATCGSIAQMSSPNPVDWADIPKIRYLMCTKREDHVGAARDNRDLLESPLLTRNVIMPSEQDSYAEAIRGLWHGSDACPFHKGNEQTKNAHDQKAQPAVSEQSLQSPGGSVASIQASSPVKSSPSSAADPFKPKRGLAASHWASAPDYVPQPKFTPRLRRPIPIVRPPSSQLAKRTKGLEASSIKSGPAETSDSLTDTLTDLHASVKVKWMPPHLRHRNEEPAVLVTVGGGEH